MIRLIEVTISLKPGRFNCVYRYTCGSEICLQFFPTPYNLLISFFYSVSHKQLLCLPRVLLNDPTNVSVVNDGACRTASFLRFLSLHSPQNFYIEILNNYLCTSNHNLSCNPRCNWIADVNSGSTLRPEYMLKLIRKLVFWK